MLFDRINNIIFSMVYNKVFFKCKIKKLILLSIYKIWLKFLVCRKIIYLSMKWLKRSIKV